MGISNTMKNIYSANWSLTDEFVFTFSNTSYQLESTGYSPQDVWNMCVINIDTPQITAPINDFTMGGIKRMYSGMYGVYTTSVTFRDFEGMFLKDFFTKIWAAQYTKYFDEIKSTIHVSSAGKTIFQSDDCLISDISQSQLSHDNNQIMEFTVSFNCLSYTSNTIAGFGKPGQTTLR